MTLYDRRSLDQARVLIEANHGFERDYDDADQSMCGWGVVVGERVRQVLMTDLMSSHPDLDLSAMETLAMDLIAYALAEIEPDLRAAI